MSVQPVCDFRISSLASPLGRRPIELPFDQLRVGPTGEKLVEHIGIAQVRSEMKRALTAEGRRIDVDARVQEMRDPWSDGCGWPPRPWQPRARWRREVPETRSDQLRYPSDA